MSWITTHVLDTSTGRPASGVAVFLEYQEDNGTWTVLARGSTDADGRIRAFLADDAPRTPGVYRVRFAAGDYFQSQGVRGFYPEVHVVVTLDDPAGPYHIPLLLSPYGYCTYRGS